MFGLNLTLFQKIEIAFILVVLGIAGVFLTLAFKPEHDMHVNVFNLPTRHHPLMSNLPVSATNPIDPKKDETVTVFGSQDGTLEITQFPNDPTQHPRFLWKPDVRHLDVKYMYYRDPFAAVDAIKDPFRHALAYATYNTVFKKSLGLLNSAAMGDDQKPKEAAAREAMLNQIKNTDNMANDGTFETKLLAEVMKALATYNAKPGDPSKDSAKANAAIKVLEAVSEYQGKVQSTKDGFIDKYMDTMDKMLSSDQKQKLIDAYKAYLASTQPSTQRGNGGRRAAAAPPAPARNGAGATTIPGRGNVTTNRGNRGAASRGAATVPAGG